MTRDDMAELAGIIGCMLVILSAVGAGAWVVADLLWGR